MPSRAFPSTAVDLESVVRLYFEGLNLSQDSVCGNSVGLSWERFGRVTKIVSVLVDVLLERFRIDRRTVADFTLVWQRIV